MEFPNSPDCGTSLAREVVSPTPVLDSQVSVESLFSSQSHHAPDRETHPRSEPSISQETPTLSQLTQSDKAPSNLGSLPLEELSGVDMRPCDLGRLHGSRKTIKEPSAGSVDRNVIRKTTTESGPSHGSVLSDIGEDTSRSASVSKEDKPWSR